MANVHARKVARKGKPTSAPKQARHPSAVARVSDEQIDLWREWYMNMNREAGDGSDVWAVGDTLRSWSQVREDFATFARDLGGMLSSLAEGLDQRPGSYEDFEAAVAVFDGVFAGADRVGDLKQRGEDLGTNLRFGVDAMRAALLAMQGKRSVATPQKSEAVRK